MLKGLFADDWKKVKKALCVHGSLFIIASVIILIIGYMMYMEGYGAAQGSSYLIPLMLAILVAFPVLLISFVWYVVVLFTNGFKYFLFSLIITFFLCLILYLICILVPFGSITEGHYDYVKENVDIGEIHQWLVNYEESDHTYTYVNEDGAKTGSIYDSDWPECIKAHNPGNVLIGEKDSKRYLRVWYRFGPGMSFGFCVMEAPMDVPEYGIEDRKELQSDAFIWIAD